MNNLASKSSYWILANVAGLITYLYFASWIWAPLGDRSLPGGPGDPIIWGLTAFPVLAVCSLMNVVWIVLIFLSAQRDKRWRDMMTCLIVIAIWISVNRYDEHRQYRGDDVAIGHQSPSAPAHRTEELLR